MARESRKRGRRRGATARANSDLETHITSLGLAGVEAYKIWCRQHGFTAALNKSWQERRAERQSRARQAESERAAAAALDHARQLGLDDVQQYRSWCKQRGLADSLHKSAAQRRREVELSRSEGSAQVLANVRKGSRRMGDFAERVCALEVDPDELRDDVLRTAYAASAQLDSAARPHFADLLRQVERRAKALCSARVALDRLGAVAGNNFVSGLAALAAHADDWMRAPEDWKPESRNARRQFASLARHLLAAYEVPSPMDSAWFCGCGEEARVQQAWFKHVGRGGNIRCAALPLELSKRMAHAFLEAPDHLLVEEALRWAQVVGMGGSSALAEALVETDLGRSFADEDFWASAVLFLVENPMLDPEMVGPIIDYVRQQRFAPQWSIGPDGLEIEGPPAQPGYSMKGRSAVKLLRQVEEWHAELARGERLPAGAWTSSGIGALNWCDARGVRWHIGELLTPRELAYEGRQMHHCVASYARNCQRGSKSVWSVQAEEEDGRRTRVMTIAVHNASRNIVEARGRYNTRARRSAKGPQDGALEGHYRALLAQTGRVIQEWMEQENLGRTNRAY